MEGGGFTFFSEPSGKMSEKDPHNRHDAAHGIAVRLRREARQSDREAKADGKRAMVRHRRFERCLEKATPKCQAWKDRAHVPQRKRECADWGVGKGKNGKERKVCHKWRHV